MQEIPADVGRVLERLRRDAGPKKQSDLAEALGLHPSRISRLETGAAQPEADEVVQYLKVIGGEAAALYSDILATRWVEIDRPDPWHPNARALIDAMALLQRLDEQVIADPALPQSLSGQAQFLRDRLLKLAAYLSNLAHRIAFIGKIGDGKTTAICFQTGLTRPSQKQPRDLGCTTSAWAGDRRTGAVMTDKPQLYVVGEDSGSAINNDELEDEIVG